ncbi:sigma-E processing peptidase SpoIIGA [Oscillospiraceae bacterium MB08-C2-2]|nr:sigma-E processing peptidase SpoIIGA [Oscillospiraceae bacterium MB08-C2-2]
MDTYVYVDVLMVLNYAVTMLLILCCSRLSGRMPRRSRVILGSLAGAASSLVIFLPYMGFILSTLIKLAVSSLIVAVVYAPLRRGAFLMQLFLFFTVNFLFAGVMVALWFAFAPQGMLCFNGAVYFDISPVVLIGCTGAAYLVLTVANRIFRGSRLPASVFEVKIFLNKKNTRVTGLLDTGNSLYEPFSATPVMICWVGDLVEILPPQVVDSVLSGEYLTGKDLPLSLRLIPYEGLGQAGLIPAFRPDRLELSRSGHCHRVERVYIGLSPKKVGTSDYNAILNPDLASVPI